MSLSKDVSLKVDVSNDVEGIKLSLKTVGDKLLVTADPGLYDPSELKDAVASCLEFIDSLKVKPPEDEL